MPVQWNLLDTNAPARVGQSFNLMGAYQQGQDRGLMRRGAEQKLEMNALDMQQQRMQMQPQAPTRKQQSTQLGADLDNQKKMTAIGIQSAQAIFRASDQEILPIALELTKRNGELFGIPPEQVQEHLRKTQQWFQEGGPNKLREEAKRAGMQLQQQGQGQTPAIKNYEYGQQNPGFAEAQQQKQRKGAETYSPSPLKKLIDERQVLVDAGAAPDDPRVVAYDSKISGTEIDVTNITQEEIDVWGNFVLLTGKMPSLGRGKSSTKVRLGIAKSAARQALDADGLGIVDEPNKTPAEAALGMLTAQSDTKSIQGALNFLDKQVSSMGSFVTNIGLQVEKVNELSADLKTFDSRILNLPLRAVRGKIAGSALQAKYDMYLTEIESEIGKLATGSSASIAELSTSAQEKWASIHDKNLSVKDMLSLLDETAKAAKMRLDSVEGQLQKTRTRMVNREGVQGAVATPAAVQQTPPTNPQGWLLHEDAQGNKAYVSPDGKQFEEVQ